MSDTPEVIHIKVLWSSTNEEIEFKLKKDTPFSKVKKLFVLSTYHVFVF
jgi:hypothetical protein